MGNAKSKLKWLGRFRSLGGLGVCRSHRQWLQLRACKIWCKSVRKTPILWPNMFFNFWSIYFSGSRRREPPWRGHPSYPRFWYSLCFRSRIDPLPIPVVLYSLGYRSLYLWATASSAELLQNDVIINMQILIVHKTLIVPNEYFWKICVFDKMWI